MKRGLQAVAVGWMSVVLAACGGGGGGGGSACADGDIHASFSYPDGLMGKVGSPATTVPAVSGVPASCNDALRFALSSGTLPPGMALDARTGVVAGTPTASGRFLFEVKMTVSSFSGSLSGGVEANINDLAAYGFSGWEVMTTGAPFLDDFRLATFAGKLYAVSRGFYSHGVETYESTDGGAHWTQLMIPGPLGDLRAFALASDAAGIYLSGGSDGSTVNSGVWRFDGTAWTQRTAAGAFTAREHHAMVSHAGALYILGGRSGMTFFEDTWKSVDGGVTWTLASATGFQPRYDFCAVSDGAGAMLVTGGHFLTGLESGTTVRNAVFRSTDGASWTGLPVSGTSPVMTTIRTHSGACAMLGNRIVYVGDSPGFSADSSFTVSSDDGVTWNYEPHHATAFGGMTPGGASLGGRVYVSSGSGTSQRTVTRSVP
jgi:hypothetical protein